MRFNLRFVIYKTIWYVWLLIPIDTICKHLSAKSVSSLSCRSIFLLGIISRMIPDSSIESNISKTLATVSSLITTFKTNLSSSQIRSTLLLLIEVSTLQLDIPLLFPFKDFFIEILSSYPYEHYAAEHCNLVLQCVYKITLESIKNDSNLEGKMEVKKSSIANNM